MTTTIIALPDHQIPYHDPRAVDVATQIVAHYQPDYGFVAGDYYGLDQISRWRGARMDDAVTRDLGEDFETGNRILRRYQKASPSTKWWFGEGNHDRRIADYAQNHPQLKNLIGRDKLVDPSLGVEFVPCDSEGVLLHFAFRKKGPPTPMVLHPTTTRLVEPGFSFIHGWSHAKNHARVTLQKFGWGDLWYCHTHGVQMTTVERWGCGPKPKGGSLGCLCETDLEYMRGRPNTWQQAVGVFVVDGFDYVPMIVNINNGRAILPDGTKIESRLK